MKSGRAALYVNRILKGSVGGSSGFRFWKGFEFGLHLQILSEERSDGGPTKLESSGITRAEISG